MNRRNGASTLPGAWDDGGQSLQTLTERKMVLMLSNPVEVACHLRNTGQDSEEDQHGIKRAGLLMARSEFVNSGTEVSWCWRDRGQRSLKFKVLKLESQNC